MFGKKSDIVVPSRVFDKVHTVFEPDIVLFLTSEGAYDPLFLVNPEEMPEGADAVIQQRRYFGSRDNDPDSKDFGYCFELRFCTVRNKSEEHYFPRHGREMHGLRMRSSNV